MSEELRRVLATLDQYRVPYTEIRASETGLRRLLALLPRAPEGTDARIYGVPIVVDPLLPPYFAMLVVDGDPVFFDLRPRGYGDG